MPDEDLCRECGRAFTARRDEQWCSQRCAARGWAAMHPNVPVRRPGRHRGPDERGR